MAKATYIGTKERKEDNVAGTGLSWTPGQTHEVSALAASKLSAHPSVWEVDMEGEEPKKAVAKPQKVEEEPIRPALADLSQMTKAQIVEYAQRELGVEIPDEKKDDMINRVRNLVGARAFE